jgi:hypothetical protein
MPSPYHAGARGYKMRKQLQPVSVVHAAPVPSTQLPMQQGSDGEHV